MLRWELGSYVMMNINGGTTRVPMSGNVQQDLNTWVRWTVDLSIGSSNGHVIVSRNGQVVGKTSGKTGTDDPSHLKLGIYTQHVNEVCNMQHDDSAVRLDYFGVQVASVNIYLTSTRVNFSFPISCGVLCVFFFRNLSFFSSNCFYRVCETYI